MAIPKTYAYTVTGKGRFPIDMLRYDLAHPAHESDSVSIAVSMADGPWRDHVVNLLGFKPPTPARWDSFGWTLVMKEA